MLKRWCGLFFLALVHLALPAGAAAQVLSFQTTTRIESAGEVGSVEFPGQVLQLVDIEGDDALDLVVADANSEVIKIFRGDGTGNFSTDAIERECGDAPIAVTTADLLNRGRIDLVVVNGLDETVTLLFQGDDPFDYSDVRVIADVVTNPVGVAAFDMNADDRPDLAVLGANDDDDVEIFLLRNDGDRNFASFSPASISISGGSDPQSIVSGEFNNDNRVDFAITYSRDTGGQVASYTSNGNGSFQNRGAIGISGSELSNLVAVDFDRNNNLDLGTADRDADADEPGFRQLTGAGNGTFRVVAADDAQFTETFPAALAIGDFNDDDFPDVVTCHGAGSGSSTMSIVESRVEGGEYAGLTRNNNVRGIEPGPSQAAVIAGDVSRDGRDDIIVWMDNGDIRVLVNQGVIAGDTPTPSPTFPSGVPTFTPTPSVPPTATSTATQPPTATPIPFAPFGRCDRLLTGIRPAAVSVGRFDGDIRPDIAIADATGDRVVTLLNPESGDLFTLASCDTPHPSSLAVSVGDDPRAMAVLDLNRDSVQDLVVATTQGIDLLTGSSSGAFVAAGTLAAGNDSKGVVAADINRDGRDDVAVVDGTSATLSIFYATGNAAFAAPVSIDLGRAGTSVATGLLNLDGQIDVAAASADIKVLLQDAAEASRFRPIRGFGSGATIKSILTGDFNRDGVLDLAVARDNGEDADGVTETYQGSNLPSGDPAYDRVAIVPARRQPSAAGVADFDRDARLDIVVANKGSANLSFALGDGTGQFPIRLLPFDVATLPVSLAAADIDLDGIADVVVASEGSGTTGAVSILLSSRPPPTPTPSETPSPTITPTSTPEGSATATSDGTSTPTPSATPSFTRTRTFTHTLTPTVTASLTPTKVGIIALTGPGCSASASSGASLGWLATMVAGGLLIRRRRLRLALLVLLGLGIDTSALRAQVPTPTPTFPGNYRPCYVTLGVATTRGVVGDFDRNGTPDIAVLTPGDQALVLLTNRAHFAEGSCAEGVTQSPISAGSRPSGITAADFNANDTLDLAVTSRNGVTILTNDGNGVFSSNGPLPTPAPPTPGISDASDVAAGFLNDDVFRDLVVGDGAGNKVVLLLGRGNGSFDVGQVLDTEDAVLRVGSADFNADAREDVIALDELGNATVFLQGSDGVFVPAAVIDIDASPVDLGIAVTNLQQGVLDFDQNDLPDLAFAGRSATSGSIAAFLGNLSSTTLSYVPSTVEPVGRPSGLAIGDFNRDTRLDVVCGDQSVVTLPLPDITTAPGTTPTPRREYPVRFFLGDGDGGLDVGGDARIDAQLAGPPTGMLAADVDGDGRLDPIVLGDSNSIAFLLSSNPESTPTFTPTPTGTFTATPTATPSPANTTTNTFTPTSTPTPTPTRVHSHTHTPTLTHTLTPTLTPVQAFILSGGGCSASNSAAGWPLPAALSLLLFSLTRRRAK